MSTTELATPTVAIDDIIVDPEFNPRRTRNGQKFAELVENIALHGIITPVLVEPVDGGKYKLIAGGRRVAAAREAGVTLIPVHVREAGDEATTFAVLENLQREDLNPIDEALGFSRVIAEGQLNQRELAEKLSISPAYVSERLQLLRLPELIQDWIAEEVLTTGCSRFLSKVAKASEPLAVWLAYVATVDESIDPSKIDSALPYVIGRVQRFEETPEGLPPRPPLVSLTGQLLRDDVDWEGREDLLARWDALESEEGFRFRAIWGPEDVDAARAFGCLFSFVVKTSWRDVDHHYATDSEWVAERVTLLLAEAEKDLKAQRRREKKEAKAAAGEGEPLTEEEIREARAQERAEAEAEKQAAQARNEELGRTLMVKMHAPKVTTARMKLLAYLIIQDNPDLALGGLGQCDERLIEKETTELKNGKSRTKLTFLSQHEATEVLLERVRKARNVEEVLGVIMQALIAGHHVDPHARPAAQRTKWYAPHVHRYENVDTYAVIDAIDKDALTVLPKAEADELRAAKAERAARDAALA